VDIDETKRALEELTSVVSQPLLTLSGDLMVTRANPAFFSTFNCTAENTQGRNIYELCGRAFNVPGMRTLLEGVLPEKNRVDQYRIQATFGKELRNMSVGARRLYHPSKGTQLTLLAFELSPLEKSAQRA
jgi:two-component system CheB/CheR fusion protein